VAGFCEYGIDNLDSIQGGKSVDHLRDYQLLNAGSFFPGSWNTFAVTAYKGNSRKTAKQKLESSFYEWISCSHEMGRQY
jgi:hypothetical protein